MADPNIGQIASVAWERKFGDKPTDNIFTSRAFFYSMGKDGFKEEADGGRLFEYGVMFAENSNFHSYGKNDELDTSQIDVFDAARYDQKICAGTVVLNELDKLRASGDSAKYGDLMELLLNNGKDSHIADMNRQMLGAGVPPNDIDGIQFLISTTPTVGSVGGINGATFIFWRNRQNSGAQSASAFDNLRSAWTTTYNQCTLGGIKNTPRWVLTDRTVFQGYEAILVAVEQIQEMKMKENADIAFNNEMLKFKGAVAFFDEDAPAGNAYFYNNVNLKVPYLKGGWMKMYPPRDPHNQLATVNKVATFANLATNARRHLGVCNAIT